MSESIYERIGGKEAVSAAVDIFYGKVLADDRIKHYFEGVDMERQKGKQKVFLTMAFGGPVKYEGKDLREAHAHLEGLNGGHFDAVAENLLATLQELNVPEELTGEVMTLVGGTRGDVLGAHS